MSLTAQDLVKVAYAVSFANSLAEHGVSVEDYVKTAAYSGNDMEREIANTLVFASQVQQQLPDTFNKTASYVNKVAISSKALMAGGDAAAASWDAAAKGLDHNAVEEAARLARKYIDQGKPVPKQVQNALSRASQGADNMKATSANRGLDSLAEFGASSPLDSNHPAVGSKMDAVRKFLKHDLTPGQQIAGGIGAGALGAGALGAGAYGAYEGLREPTLMERIGLE